MKKGVDHIGVTCVFFCHDGNGRVLLHKRSQNCRDEQGRWDCGGGSMEFGETFDQTVRREVFEEYGVLPEEVVNVEAKNVLRTHNETQTHWIAVLHAVKISPDNVKIGEPEKMDDIGWFHIDDFPEERHSMLDCHFEIVKPFIKTV